MGKARALPEMLEQRVVTQTIFEFDVEDDLGLTRLRVTVGPKGLRVRDVWDKDKSADCDVGWLDLRSLGRFIVEYERSVEDARHKEECVDGMIRELRCALAGVRRVPSECRKPDCGGPITFQGPSPTGELSACDFGPLAWPRAREVRP